MDINNPIINTALITSIDNLKKDYSTENEKIFFKELVNANFLAPVIIDPALNPITEKKLYLNITGNNYNQRIQPKVEGFDPKKAGTKQKGNFGEIVSSDNILNNQSRIYKAVDGDELLTYEIVDALENNAVDRVLSKIDDNGNVKTLKLDIYGNKIGEWP